MSRSRSLLALFATLVNLGSPLVVASGAGALGFAPSPPIAINGGSGDPESLLADKHGGLWVGDVANGTVVRLTGLADDAPAIGTPIDVGTTATGIGAMAFDAAGDLWVTLPYVDEVVRVEKPRSATPIVDAPLAVGTLPFGLIADRAGNLWVANSGDGTIQEITGATHATPIVHAPIAVGSNLGLMTTDEAGNLWVTLDNNAGQVARVSSPSSAPVVTTYAVGSDPYGVIALPNGKIWVANEASPGTSSVQEITRAQSAHPRVHPAIGSYQDAYGLAWAHSQLFVLDAGPYAGTYPSLASTGDATLFRISHADDCHPRLAASLATGVSLNGTYFGVTNFTADGNGNLWAASFDHSSVQRVTLLP